MTIEFACPHCRTTLETEDSRAGQMARCPGCGERVSVPAGRLACSTCGALVESGDRQCAACGSMLGGPATVLARPQWHRPPQLNTIGWMMIGGGSVALVLCVGEFFAGFVCCVPFVLIPFSLFLGIFATVNGIQLQGTSPPRMGVLRTVAIMQIVHCVAFFDVINLVLGIVTINMLNDPEVEAFLSKASHAT